MSYLIQDGEKQIIFDTGYSDAFIANVRKLHFNLLDSDYVVLSHDHLDHAWGLNPLIKLYTEAQIESLTYKRATLVAHPHVLTTRSLDELSEVGVRLSLNYN